MSYKSYKNSHIEKGYGKKYDQLYKKDCYDSRVWILEQEILEKIFKNYFKKKINYFLDFACGTGRLLNIFEKKAISSYGIDVSEDMLREAKKKFKNTTFIKIDIIKKSTNIDFKFNLITCFRFFLNAEESLKNSALTAIYNILDDNGIFIFNIHGNKYSTIYLFNSNRNINTISISKIRKLLKSHRFKIIKLYGISYLPWDASIYLSKRLWLCLEKFIAKLKVFNKFGTNIIIICKKVSQRKHN